MERIYSAFFTTDRRRDVALTAAALARHDQDTRHHKPQPQPQSQQQPSHAAAPSSPSSHVDRRAAFAAAATQANANADTAAAPTDEAARAKRLQAVLTDHHAVANSMADEDDDHDDEEVVTVLEMDVDAAMVDLHGREFTALVRQRYSLSRDLAKARRAATRTFLLAYGAKAFTALLLASRKWSSIEYGYADAVRLLVRMDTLRFGAFFGSLVAVFRVSEIAARRVRGRRDRVNLAIAGGLSGMALLVDSEARRSTIALYVFVRMLDVVGRHLTAVGCIPSWRYSSEGLFAASNAFIMYAFLVDPTLLPQGYYDWILRMGAVTHEGLEYTVRSHWRGDVDAHGSPVPFRRCQPHYHVESCLTHSVTEWVNGLGRGLQIYGPVHFLPALIFRFQKLQSAPLSSTARISYNALCSSAFLTSYQTIVKLCICVVRNTLHQDYVFESWIGGLGTGVSLFFEQPKRRFELMLYCFPRALDIIWQLLKRRRLVRYVKHSEVVLFCLSMSLIMSRPPEHFKPTYLRILRFVFGRDII